MKTLPDAVVEALREVLGPGQVALHEPWFGGREQDYVNECIESTFVSSVGAFVDRFERDLAEYTGAQRAVAVVNGTAGLQVALRVAGVLPGGRSYRTGAYFCHNGQCSSSPGCDAPFCRQRGDDAGTRSCSVARVAQILCRAKRRGYS